MKIIDLLEARSADLYHGTDLARFNRIIQDNVLQANTPIHRKDIPNQYKGMTKTVSLARSSTVATSFARAASADDDSYPVVLVLDQDKLYRNLGKRMRPYDDLPSMFGDKHSPRAKGSSEAEEAVFGTINNINAYIKQIVVHFPEKYSKDDLAYITKFKNIMKDPRTVVVDFLDKNLTGLQFMRLVNDRLLANSIQTKGMTA